MLLSVFKNKRSPYNPLCPPAMSEGKPTYQGDHYQGWHEASRHGPPVAHTWRCFHKEHQFNPHPLGKPPLGKGQKALGGLPSPHPTIPQTAPTQH